jgi:glyoxylate utilization-related uncharacterized protein
MTNTPSCYAPHGGLPGQDELLSSGAIFPEACAIIPRRVMTAIVSFLPGGANSFSEIDVREHGIEILEGKGVYGLNDNRVEVQEGHSIGLRAFCPRACHAGGPGRFGDLLMAVNCHMPMRLGR